jgi:hypothetical protein
MRIRRWLLIAVVALASTAHADDDWLAGEYEVVVPNESTPFVLVITRDAEGHLDEAVYSERGDAASGRSFMRIEPWRPHEPWHGGKADELREISDQELAAEGASDMVRAHLRCAVIGGLAMCRVPDGGTFEFDGRTLGPGYFGFAMHVGYIDMHRRARDAMPAVPLLVPQGAP